MSDARCERITSTVSGWNVHCFNQTYKCADVGSHHLPCRHLMHFPCKEHQFELLPAMAISERWSLSSALNVKDELAAAADSQQSIVQMSKLKSPKVRLPYGSPNGSPNGHQTNDEGRVVPASKPTKQVVYFRFRRNERANQKRYEHTPGKSARQVDIINVPNLLRREKARTQLKQLKLTRGADQLAVPNYPSHLTMSLKQLLEWATKASNLKEVLEMLEKYPVQLKDLYLWARMPECHWEVVRTSHYMHTFVILADLAGPCGLHARQTDKKAKKQGLMNNVVVTIDPKLWNEFVGVLTAFYNVKAKCRSKWLEYDWRKVDSVVERFAVKTKTCGSFTGNCSDAATSTGQRDYIKIHIQPAAYSICGAVKCGVVRALCRGWLNECLEVFWGRLGSRYCSQHYWEWWVGLEHPRHKYSTLSSSSTQ
ncbi:hypothetical protein GQ600_25631 [Phytophthora cactorum]|nr:hypothetical protein GQ600_25631 [Phytophthora cactorum]